MADSSASFAPEGTISTSAPAPILPTKETVATDVSTSTSSIPLPETCGPNAPSGFLGNVSPEQQAKVGMLRNELSAEGCSERLDDASLLRFLRARKFDLQKAKEMFLECEKWRQDFKVDEIVSSFSYDEKPLVSKYYPQYYHKTDVEGRPVYIEQLGSVNLTEMYKITTFERMLQNLVWEYEQFVLKRLPACSRKAGVLIETSCTIMDLKGVGISSIQQVYQYVREASVIGQNYYPERMGKFYMINAPFGFATAFRLIRPLLDPVTVSKIFILSSSYQSELGKQIPAENLPKKFGGLCDCPGGCELSDAGPWHDPTYM
ncbi:CRAL-TRIO domain-containing protein [Lipomyces oligophaga]|uniref:CRAL-TRIO domain-containing protein n=1 Tax=Lipomyces oligophaga TaxID=45792 RepID=UPI0034D01AAF